MGNVRYGSMKFSISANMLCALELCYSMVWYYEVRAKQSIVRYGSVKHCISIVKLISVVYSKLLCSSKVTLR